MTAAALRNAVRRWLLTSRNELDHVRPRWRRSLVSPVLFGLHHSLVPRLTRLAHGRFLDAGCGRMPYRDYVIGRTVAYTGVDREAQAFPGTLMADVCALPIRGNAYDVVLCSEVLEHVDNPDAAFAELSRVLCPGGTLILTVPFLGRLHEEPHDYFRFTRHALRSLAVRHGLIVRELVSTGSVFGFLAHQISSVLVVPTYRIPLAGEILFWVNAALIVLPASLLDRLLPLRERLPLGYVLVAQRDPESVAAHSESEALE